MADTPIRPFDANTSSTAQLQSVTNLVGAVGDVTTAVAESMRQQASGVVSSQQASVAGVTSQLQSQAARQIAQSQSSVSTVGQQLQNSLSNNLATAAELAAVASPTTLATPARPCIDPALVSHVTGGIIFGHDGAIIGRPGDELCPPGVKPSAQVQPQVVPPLPVYVPPPPPATVPPQQQVGPTSTVYVPQPTPLPVVPATVPTSSVCQPYPCYDDVTPYDMWASQGGGKIYLYPPGCPKPGNDFIKYPRTFMPGELSVWLATTPSQADSNWRGRFNLFPCSHPDVLPVSPPPTPPPPTPPPLPAPPPPESIPITPAREDCVCQDVVTHLVLHSDGSWDIVLSSGDSEKWLATLAPQVAKVLGLWNQEETIYPEGTTDDTSTSAIMPDDYVPDPNTPPSGYFSGLNTQST